MISFAWFLLFPIALYPTADTMYLQYGLGTSDSIEAGNPTFHAEIIVNYKHGWSVKYKHESSLLHHDEDFGENSMVLYRTWRMK